VMRTPFQRLDNLIVLVILYHSSRETERQGFNSNRDDLNDEALFLRMFVELCLGLMQTTLWVKVILFYIIIILYNEVSNQISTFLKSDLTEKYKVRIFMYPNLYGRRIW
jgi:hypothetical protein